MTKIDPLDCDHCPSAQVEKRVAELVRVLGLKGYEVIDLAIQPLEERVRSFQATALRDHVMNGITLRTAPREHERQRHERQHQEWSQPVAPPIAVAPPKPRRAYTRVPQPEVTDPALIPPGAMPERDIAAALGVPGGYISSGGRLGKHQRFWVKPGRRTSAPLALAMPDEVEAWVKAMGR